MSEGGKRLKTEGNVDGSDFKKQKTDNINSNPNNATSEFNSNFDDFGGSLNSNQLDDILNNNLPGIDVKSESKDNDVMNFDFDNLPTDFLDNDNFDLPSTEIATPIGGIPSELPSGIPSGIPSGDSSRMPSVGPSAPTPAAPQREGTSSVPPTGSTASVSSTSHIHTTNAPNNQQAAKISNSKVASPEVNAYYGSDNTNNSNSNINSAPRSYVGSPAPSTPSAAINRQNLNIYTGNGGINGIPTGVNITSKTNATKSGNSSSTSTPGYSGSNNNAATNNKNANSNDSNRSMVYNPKVGYITTAPAINRTKSSGKQVDGTQSSTPKSEIPGNTKAPSINDGVKSTVNTGSNVNINGVGAPAAASATGADTPSGPTSKISQLHTDDPAKLNDALAAAGVDIQQEEELLMQQHGNRNKINSAQQQLAQRQKQQQSPRIAPFLNPYHLSSFMQKVAKENGVNQNFLQDSELLELVSSACENWISNLTTKTIILSRHRRRGIPTIIEGRSGKKGNNNATTPSSQRSETSRELRNLAVRQKEMEEKRVQKRIALGLENGTPGAGSENGKAGAEETLHRAANATAAMMSTGRKKYSWMTAGASRGGLGGGGGGDDGSSGKPGDGEGKSKQSSIIAIRGDNGLRYREIRTGKTVTMKDLLGALEDERMGVEKTLIKGYAKMKD